MAVFMNIEGLKIKGESTDEDHKDWIEFDSFSLGVMNPVSMGSGQGSTATARASFEPFSCSKVMDASSPLLNYECAAGTIFEEVEIHLAMSLNGEQAVYQKYKFKKAAISNISVGGGEGMKPQETLTMGYTEVEWIFTPHDHMGKKQADVIKSWSLATNKGA